MAAVNQGEVYRFLAKPCPPVALGEAVRAAVAEVREASKSALSLEPGTTVEEAERRLILLTLEHTRDNKTRPNVLRAVLGDSSSHAALSALDWETDSIAVLETNLDDVSGEVLGAFVERAFATGALDVFHTPIQMKKNRPGVLLTVLCAAADADKFSALVLRETSAFGVRRAP